MRNSETNRQIVLKGNVNVNLEIDQLVDIVDERIYIEGELIGRLDFSSCKEDQLEELDESYDIVNEKLGLVVSISDKASGLYEFMLIRDPQIHIHSGYSLLDGAASIKDIVKKASPFTALTDHGNMFGTFQFYTQMKKAGKRPMIGCEFYVEDLDGQKKANHLILLAKNQKGYENLCELISASEANFYRRPQLSYDMLEEFNEGLICTSACLGGSISRALAEGDYDRAAETAEILEGLFGDDFYLEIQNHGIAIESTVNPLLVQLSEELDIKLVAATDSHYVDEEDSYAHEVLLCLQTGTNMDDDKRFSFDGAGYHIHTPIEFERRFKDYPQAISNLYEIAKKINFEFKTDEVYMPVFDIPEDFESEEDYFRHVCEEGLEERFKDMDKESDDYKLRKERLDFEIETIKGMGYCGYFLIVWDFIKYAREQNVPVGPGRGSAVGSLVSYSLKITNIDPIPYDLLFERFLNPERISLPDIDIDFSDEKRHIVVDYVREKYGDENVSDIITFGTMAARAAVRDVARALNKPYEFGQKISSAIPAEPKMTITKAFSNPEFKYLYDSDDEVKRVVDIAIRLEGLPRHKSTHACGKVISKFKIRKICPEVLVEDKKTKVVARVAAFDMNELEDLGLLKMDFLGLRNMGVIGNSLEDISAKYHTLNEDDIPVDDPYVYELISTGETLGIFQIESDGMQDLVKKMFSDVSRTIKSIEKEFGCKGFYNLEITNDSGDVAQYKEKMKKFGAELFERLIAAISLYRPGPMDYIPQYLEGMLDPETIHYDTPMLEEILSKTYGVIVYQEQVQQIVRKLAGYSLARGDLIRRAMGKKNEKIMNEERETFLYGNAETKTGNEALVPGCVANGVPEEEALVIWDKMVEFARYAFNKSHSAGYADIAIKTAFLKNYYRVEFMAHTINSVIGKAQDVRKYLNGAKSMGIEILPPSVNHSVQKSSVEGDSIRIGLTALKSLGKSAIPLLNEREANGKYVDILDLLDRLAGSFTKKTIEVLALAGAFDEFGHSRRTIHSQASKMVGYSKDILGGVSEGEQYPELDKMYKDLCFIQIEELEEFEKQDKLEKEFEISGMYLSEHPLDDYQEVFTAMSITEIENLMPTSIEDTGEEIESPLVDSFVNVAGIVKELLPVYTKKKNDLMYILKLEDRTEIITCVVFPNVAKQIKDFIEERIIVNIKGRLEDGERGLQIIASSVEELSEKSVAGYRSAGLVLKDSESLSLIGDIADANYGKTKLFIKIGDNITAYKHGVALTMGTIAKFKEIAVDTKFLI